MGDRYTSPFEVGISVVLDMVIDQMEAPKQTTASRFSISISLKRKTRTMGLTSFILEIKYPPWKKTGPFLTKLSKKCRIQMPLSLPFRFIMPLCRLSSSDFSSFYMKDVNPACFKADMLPLFPLPFIFRPYGP
jgi:hypothetical protein